LRDEGGGKEGHSHNKGVEAVAKRERKQGCDNREGKSCDKQWRDGGRRVREGEGSDEDRKGMTRRWKFVLLKKSGQKKGGGEGIDKLRLSNEVRSVGPGGTVFC